MVVKDGRALCFGCGHRVDGIFSGKGHARDCSVGASSKRRSKPIVRQPSK